MGEASFPNLFQKSNFCCENGRIIDPPIFLFSIAHFLLKETSLPKRKNSLDNFTVTYDAL